MPVAGIRTFGVSGPAQRAMRSCGAEIGSGLVSRRRSSGAVCMVRLDPGVDTKSAVTHQATHIAAKRTPATGATTIITNNPDMWRA